MTPQERSVVQIQSELYAYFDQVRFARATELARLKRYLEAEAVLAPEGRVSGDPKELDLLARISAQQHAYERACLLWEAALQRSPGHQEYQQSIEQAKPAEKRYVAFQKKVIYGLFLISLCTLGLAIWSLLHWHTPPPVPAAPTTNNTTPPPPPKTEPPVTKTPVESPAPSQPATPPPDSAKPTTKTDAPATPPPSQPATAPQTNHPIPEPAQPASPPPAGPSNPTPGATPSEPATPKPGSPSS